MSKLNTLKICLLLLLVTVFYHRAEAQCFTGWMYKLPVTIDNSSLSTNLTNYQVKITVDTKTPITNGKMHSSGSDIRFATSTCANVEYWIETGINTTTTVIWLKVPSLAGSSKTTIDMYYGKSGASAASNADSVFMLYDDFDTKNTNKWTYTTGYTYRHSSGAFGLAGDANSKVSTRSVNTFPDNIIMESSLNKNDGCSDHFIYASKSTSATWDWSSTSGVLRFGWNCGNKTVWSQSTSTDVGCSSLTTYDIKATITGSGVSLDDNKCSSVSLTATTFSGYYIYIGADTDASSTYADFYWFRVRKYASTEPTSSVGTEKYNKDFSISFTGTSFCPGATFNIGVSSSSITFNSGNVFTAQLSNASGSFASPVTLGSVTATSGSFSATIPINTTPGTGYRIRVISSSPKDSSMDNGTNLTILSLPATNAGSDKTVCLGGSITIGNTATAGSTYSWSPAAGLNATNVANPTANPTSTTTYIVKETSGSGCINFDTVIVFVTSPPAANAGLSRNICANQGATIGTTAVVGNSYSWSSKPAGFTSGSALVTVYPSTTTTYYLTETNISSGCVKKDSVKITVVPSIAANRLINKNICAGSGIVLGEPAVPGNTYSWTSVPSGFTSTSANPAVSPTTNTIYVLKQNVTSTGCSRTDSFYVIINALPAANAGSNRSVCSGTMTQIGAAEVAGNTYSWTSNPAGFTSFSANPSVAPTTTTVYTVTETNNTTGCSKTGSVTVSVNPLPYAYVGANQLICFGSSVTLGDKAVSGNSYKWFPATGLSSDTVANPVASPKTDITYTLTETNKTTGCINTNKVTVSLLKQPVAFTGADRAICRGDKTTIGGTPAFGSTYSWSPSTGLSSDTVSNPVANPAVTTTYTLTETIAATGCTNSSTITVKVTPLPAANAGSNQAICSGTSVNLGTSSVPGHSYSWSPSSGLSSTIISNPVATPATTTKYYLIETNDSAGCTKMDSVTITVIPTPLADAGKSKTICQGEKTQLGASPVAGRKYSWSPSTGLSSDAIANPIASPFTTTTYTLTETNTVDGTVCTQSNSITITVATPPAPSAGSNQTICSGSSVMLGMNSVPGNSYRWSPAAGLSSTTISNPVATPLKTTTYYLVETNDSTGCMKRDTVIITVTPAPVADAGNNKIICQGGKTQIGGTAVAGRKYSWSPSTGLSSDAVADPIASPFTTTTYTLTETNLANDCKKTNTVTVTVTPQPYAFVGQSQSICIGESVKLGTTATANHTYIWTPSRGLSSSTVSDPVASPNTTTTYYLVETDNLTSCSKKDSVTITVLPKLSTFISGPADVCKNATATYNAPVDAASVYNWEVDGGVITSGFNTDKVTVLWTAGKGSVKLIESRGGCSDSFSKTINIAPLPNANWNYTKVGNKTYRFKPVDTTLVNYLWDFGDGTTSTFMSPTHTYPKDSIYMISLTVQNAGDCKASQNGTILMTGVKDQKASAVKVNIYPNPFKDITNINYTLNKRSQVKIQVIDITGKEVAVLENSMQEKGNYISTFDAAKYNTQAGVYLVKILVDDNMVTKQIIMLK